MKLTVELDEMLHAGIVITDPQQVQAIIEARLSPLGNFHYTMRYADDLIFDEAQCSNGISLEDNSYRESTKLRLMNLSMIDVHWKHRVYGKHEIIDGIHCREWQGYVKSSGYGNIGCRIHADEKYMNRRATRVSYTIFNGWIKPRNLQVHHKCDNRLCIEPTHLTVGDDLKNATEREIRRKQKAAIEMGLIAI